MKNSLFTLGVSTTLASVAVLGLAVAPTEAASLGSVAISGDSSFDVNSDVFSFSSVNVEPSDEDAEGIFDGLEGTSVTVKDLQFNNNQTYNAVVDYLTFTNGITFDLNAGTAEFKLGGLAFESNFTGLFKNTTSGQVIGEGNFSVNTTGNSSSYALSAQAVPEPTTMLGLAIAGGLGAFGVKKKKQSENA